VRQKLALYRHGLELLIGGKGQGGVIATFFDRVLGQGSKKKNCEAVLQETKATELVMVVLPVGYIFGTNRSHRIVVHRVDKDTRPMAILA